MTQHPAHQMDFDTLLGGLNAEVANGNVYERQDGDLSLYCYSKGCVYDQAWNPITEVARGLIIDRAQRQIVATPFPKFFNLGEGAREAPMLDFEATIKEDGSLIIGFHHNGEWRTATKGSFYSDQAKVALTMLRPDILCPGVTYLAELIGPSNKIVISYPRDELRLLSAFDTAGYEFTRDELAIYDYPDSFSLVNVFACESIADLIVHTASLPASEEGYVLRFSDGTRLKLKGDEYRRLHAMISRLSPLTVWEALQQGDAEAMRRELPEEFWADFDQMRSLLTNGMIALVYAINQEAKAWSACDDKELGLRLGEIAEPVRSFIFPCRKGFLDDAFALTGKTRQAIFREIRPTGNKLNGYAPSSVINRVLEEAL